METDTFIPVSPKSRSNSSPPTELAVDVDDDGSTGDSTCAVCFAQSASRVCGDDSFINGACAACCDVDVGEYN